MPHTTTHTLPAPHLPLTGPHVFPTVVPHLHLLPLHSVELRLRSTVPTTVPLGMIVDG